MTENTKYKCKLCKFYTNGNIAWDKHVETEKHKSGGVKRKIRCDKKIKTEIECPHCDYKNMYKICMKSHMLNNHSTKEERKNGFKHYCERCDYGTFSEKRYNDHIISQTHDLAKN
jgi:hypothetical protein